MPFNEIDAKSAFQPGSESGLNITDVAEFSPPQKAGNEPSTVSGSDTLAQVAAANGSGNKTVYLDVGHCTSAEKDPLTGKRDQGFVTENYTECQINTAVGKLVAKELLNQGIQVIPTWNPFAVPPAAVPKAEDLQRRVDTVNRDVDKYCDDSIYLSIHHDMDPTKKGGQCVYIADNKFSEATPLAKSIQNSAWMVRDRNNNPSCINSDKVTGNGQLVGLRGVNSVGVLVEAANAMNPTDRALMSTQAHQENEARGIARGVVNYFKLQPGKDRPHPVCKRGLG